MRAKTPRFLVIALLGYICLVAAQPSRLSAWGPEGHEIICEIAWRRLTPEARKLVRELRQADPEPGASFAESCNWADSVRSKSHQGTYPYHYVNVAKGAFGFEFERDCPAHDCIAVALRRYTVYLARDDAKPESRAQALKFLGHFVGDVHQPLHAGYLEDRGGNDILVSWFGQRTEPAIDPGDEPEDIDLHHVWDRLILRQAGHPKRRSARGLNAKISPERAKEWDQVHFDTWINESFQLAVDMAYDLPEGGALGAPYFERAWPVVESRIQAAGVRLAGLINTIAAGRPVVP